MATNGDVHVNDIGTLYKAHLLDAGNEFDPTAATVTQLIFKTPVTTLTRDATIVSEPATSTEPEKWFLEYTVLDTDIPLGLHKVSGVYQWQGYLEFPDGSHYSTSIESYLVKKNLT